METQSEGLLRSAVDRSPPVNILIVDDAAANRQAFESLIRPLGYLPFLAESGEEALRLATHYRFASILMDVRMPKMSGIETAECLRRKPFTHATPILFMSAHEETAIEVSRLFLPGPTDYIFSPIDGDHLTLKVQHYVALHLKNEVLRRKNETLVKARGSFLKQLSASSIPDRELHGALERLDQAIVDITTAIGEHFGPIAG